MRSCRRGWLTRMATTTMSPLMNICTKAETSSRLSTLEMMVSAMTPPTDRMTLPRPPGKRGAAEHDSDDGIELEPGAGQRDSRCRGGRPAAGRQARRRSRKARSKRSARLRTSMPARRALSALPPTATR